MCGFFSSRWSKKKPIELFHAVCKSFQPVGQSGELVAYDITWRSRKDAETMGLPAAPTQAGQVQRVYRDAHESRDNFVDRCNQLVIDEARAIVASLGLPPRY